MDYAIAILQLQNEGTLTGVDFSNANQATSYADLLILDANGQSIKPSEQDLIDAYARWLVADATEQSHATERKTIQEKAALANDFLPDIRKVLNKIIDHDIASDNQATRFLSLSAIVSTQISVGVRNRFYAAILAEQNIDISLIGIGNLTAGQQRIFLTYLRIFFNQYAMLAMWDGLAV